MCVCGSVYLHTHKHSHTHTYTHTQVLLVLEEEAARATPIPLTTSRKTSKASNLAMACCTSRLFAKQATTSRAPLALRVLLANTIPLLAALPLRLASRVLLAPTILLLANLLALRVPVTPTRCKALPLALLRVQVARPCRLALRVHVAKQATTPRAVRVSFVLQEA